MAARFLVLSLFLITAMPSAARAVVITSGDTITRLGDVKVEKLPRDLAGLTDGVGYKYSYWGIFSLDFWRSGGAYCLFKEDQYVPISEADAANYLGVSANEMGPPFFYYFPPGLIVLTGFVLFIVGIVIAKRFQSPKPEEPVSEPYAEALEIFREAVRKNEKEKQAAKARNEFVPEVDPWEAAIEHLVKAGIDKAEAEDCFSQLLAQAIASPGENQT